MGDDFETHPAADLFPMPTEAELQALAEDIKKHGQREPIVLLDGKILDGRSRYRACQLAGVEPEYHWTTGARFPDPVAYVLSRNLHRRHLTAEQKAAIVIEAATLSGELGRLKAEAQARQAVGKALASHEAQAGAAGGPQKTASKIARMAQVSRATVERVLRAAEGDPTVLKEIADGTTTSRKVLRAPLVATTLTKPMWETWTDGVLSHVQKAKNSLAEAKRCCMPPATEVLQPLTECIRLLKTLEDTLERWSGGLRSTPGKAFGDREWWRRRV
jgi:ParB-like chromosome segregation protein Spo0J